MTQRTTEWTHVTDREYHEKQFLTPYRSTVKFCDWLDTLAAFQDARTVADLGAGLGANLAYLATRYPQLQLTGLDLNDELVAGGNAYFRDKGMDRCSMRQGDLYALPESDVDAYDGVLSFQVLSWLPEAGPALQAMAALRPKWLAFSSLFYDGPVSCRVEVSDYTAAIARQACKQSYYNVYSLPAIRETLRDAGYTRFEAAPFEIDIDLPKPASPRMATYTERLADGRRLQISGPVLMPWHFVFAAR